MPHTPSPTDPFRLNMMSGHGPNTPATPAPIPPASMWYDVSNWQTFLSTHGYSCTIDNMFSPTTGNATKNFQASAQGGALPTTGIVNLATYNKAVGRGMPAYPTVS